MTGLILLAVKEFQFNGPFLKLEQNVRLLIGAAPLFWESGRIFGDASLYLFKCTGISIDSILGQDLVQYNTLNDWLIRLGGR